MNEQSIASPPLSGDRTPPSEAEQAVVALLTRCADDCEASAYACDTPLLMRFREERTARAAALRELVAEMPALLADRARVDVLSEYLDDISFHFEPGKPEPVVVLAFFVGDGGGHTTVSGDTLREATDVYLAMLARADAGEDSDEDAARAPGASGNTKNA